MGIFRSLSLRAQAANESCSALFDPCVEVVCAVRNDGGVAGVATVEAAMSQAGRSSVTRVQTLGVAARGVERAAFRFPEATMFGGAETGRCGIR